MVRRVDDCKGCGISPCYHCTAFELICDRCQEEVDELFDYSGEHFCEACWKEVVFEDSAVEIDYESEVDDDDE